MVDPPLKKLRAKRARIHQALNKLEPQVAAYRAKLAEVEAAILAIDPQLWLPPRHYQANPVFARGELPRLTLAILREAEAPLPVAMVAHMVLARKGVPLPDAKLRRLTRHRLQQVFWRFDRKGITAKVGRGNGTRRALTGVLLASVHSRFIASI